jgi:hypothetical protein
MTHLQSVQQSSFSSSVETQDQNPHFPASEKIPKVAEQAAHYKNSVKNYSKIKI